MTRNRERRKRRRVNDASSAPARFITVEHLAQEGTFLTAKQHPLQKLRRKVQHNGETLPPRCAPVSVHAAVFRFANPGRQPTEACSVIFLLAESRAFQVQPPKLSEKMPEGIMRRVAQQFPVKLTSFIPLAKWASSFPIKFSFLPGWVNI